MRQASNGLLEPAKTGRASSRTTETGSVPPVEVVVVFEALPFFLCEERAELRVANSNGLRSIRGCQNSSVPHMHTSPSANVSVPKIILKTHKVADVVETEIVAIQLPLEPIFGLG